MEKDEPKSPEEIKLFEWLTANDVYSGDELMQSLIINSFHSEFEDEGDDLISLDEIDLNETRLNEGFDYKQFEKNEEDEDRAWSERVNYALTNKDKFLSYFNDNWRSA